MYMYMSRTSRMLYSIIHNQAMRWVHNQLMVEYGRPQTEQNDPALRRDDSTCCLVSNALDELYGTGTSRSLRGLRRLIRASKRADDIDSDDSHMGIAEDLESGDGHIVCLGQLRVVGGLDQGTEWPGVGLEVAEE